MRLQKFKDDGADGADIRNAVGHFTDEFGKRGYQERELADVPRNESSRIQSR